jgi:hypothetical protein
MGNPALRRSAIQSRAGARAAGNTRRIRVTTMAKKSRKKKARKKSAANHGKRPNS